jgi:H+/gluconate symporter-like permease
MVCLMLVPLPAMTAAMSVENMGPPGLARLQNANSFGMPFTRVYQYIYI